MEANPSSITTGRALVWKAAGVNRVSIGVQSLEADTLRFLGRVHDADRALAAMAEVRDAGFTSINCDLIYAVPGLGDARWRRTLERVVAAGPTHISCYELTVEPGTPLHTQVRRGMVRPVDGVRSMRQHRIAVELLERAGYCAVRGEQLRARGRGVPPQPRVLAQRVLRGGRRRCARSPAGGCGGDDRARRRGRRRLGALLAWAGNRGVRSGDRRGRIPVAGSEPVGIEMREQERVMLGLRLREGVRIAASSLEEARALEGLGLIAIDGDRVRATARGEAVLNQVTLRLVGDQAA